MDHATITFIELQGPDAEARLRRLAARLAAAGTQSELLASADQPELYLLLCRGAGAPDLAPPESPPESSHETPHETPDGIPAPEGAVLPPGARLWRFRPAAGEAHAPDSGAGPERATGGETGGETGGVKTDAAGAV